MKVHYFNPGHETAVLNGSAYYMPPANVVAMQQELSILPAWYAMPDDVVLTNNKYNTAYCSSIKQLFSLFPVCIEETDLPNYIQAEMALWGISPQAVHYCNELNTAYNLKLAIPNWHEEYIYLNSRQAARECLSLLISRIPAISDQIIPKFYQKIEDINNAVNVSQPALLAKAPYSSSGRGLLWLPQTGLTRTENQILHGILKKQGSVSIEKVLDKQVDFAMEFMIGKDNAVDFAGYSLFYTNTKGAYQSNYIGAQQNIEKKLTELIPLSLISAVKQNIIEFLKDKYAPFYRGCVGIDMMIYKDADENKLQPCVEINMRYNMGFLALKLSENYISPLSEGRFILDFNPKEGVLYQNHLQMQQEYPINFNSGKLQKGYFALSPIHEQSRYRAYAIID